MSWIDMINANNTACRNCSHWVMDESLCAICSF